MAVASEIVVKFSKRVIVFLLVSSCFSFQLFNAIPSSLYRSEPVQEACECVRYYQCDENQVIKTDGADLLDPRIKICDNDLDVCCKVPKINEGGETVEQHYSNSDKDNHNNDSNKESMDCQCVPFYSCEDGLKVNNDGTEESEKRIKSCESGEVCCLRKEDVVHQEPGEVSINKTEHEVEKNEEKVCECLPFYVCDEKNVVMVDGSDILDMRVSCPGENEICCYLNELGNNEEESSKPPQHYQDVPLPSPPKITGCGRTRECEEVNFGDYRISGPEGAPAPTGFGEFPWMVAIFRGHHFICGGSLVHPMVVLTAAHCLLKNEIDGNLILRAGDWDVDHESEPIPHQEREAKESLPHPNFNPSNLQNDIALIILEEPFQLNDAVDLICFKNTNYVYGRDCLATGWGKTTFNPDAVFASILKKVDLPIVEKEECQERLRKTRLGKYFKLHESFICAGGIPEYDTCTGDGGGPLICPTHDGSYTQVGIVAWGIGCGNDNPAVYTSVHYFSDWIYQHIENL